MHFNLKEDVNPKSKRLERLFFAHPDAVKLWKQHPDIILMDCTYKTNRFRMPLLNICVVAGNKKTIQVALCFLSGEKEVSYEWAMKCLRETYGEVWYIPPNLYSYRPGKGSYERSRSYIPKLSSSTLHMACQYEHSYKLLEAFPKRSA